MIHKLRVDLQRQIMKKKTKLLERIYSGSELRQQFLSGTLIPENILF